MRVGSVTAGALADDEDAARGEASAGDGRVAAGGRPGAAATGVCAGLTSTCAAPVATAVRSPAIAARVVMGLTPRARSRASAGDPAASPASATGPNPTASQGRPAERWAAAKASRKALAAA